MRKNEYRASILTVKALYWLRERFPDSLLTTELSIIKHGKALLDVAAITETAIYGIEVKGDGDSTNRLLRQGWVYSRAAYQMWLLPAPSLEKGCEKHRPPGWGMLVVRDDNLQEVIQTYDPPLPNAPATLLSILWKTELLKLSKILDIKATQHDYVHTIYTRIAEQIPLSIIRQKVCQILRKRNWQYTIFNKTVYHPSDSLPEIYPQNYER